MVTDKVLHRGAPLLKMVQGCIKDKKKLNYIKCLNVMNPEYKNTEIEIDIEIEIDMENRNR